jgi:sulfoxide reductase heme-binding subunit YedZ
LRLSDRTVRWVLKPILFVGSLAPAAYLIWAALTGHLSADPLSGFRDETGVWTLRFLCVTLLITPLRRVSAWNTVIRFRRMMGLFAFFYASLHFVSYVVFDRFAALDFPNGFISWTTVRNLTASIADDIYKRAYITVGFAAFVAMVPLAVTSTTGWIRRLGGRRWQALHRLVYPAAIGGVVHYWWQVKADISRPLAYAIVVGVLLAFRLYWARMRALPRDRDAAVGRRRDVAL